MDGDRTDGGALMRKCPECGSGCTQSHLTATWCGNCSWIEDPDRLMPQSRVTDAIDPTWATDTDATHR